jgi:hypothetical protein
LIYPDVALSPPQFVVGFQETLAESLLPVLDFSEQSVLCGRHICVRNGLVGFVQVYLKWGQSVSWYVLVSSGYGF